jgi:serine/threonine protein kinase
MKCPRCQYDNPSDTNFCGKCGWLLSPTGRIPYSETETWVAQPDGLERGSTFAGRYEVIEEIGKGGMGRVYKVFDKKIKETVALKLIRPEIAADNKTIERFNNELRFARKISHRNVCRMYDIGQDGSACFITMEYVAGEDLKRFIRRSGHLTEAKAIAVAGQVCEGLSEAHRLGVLHRDLKPQNIMIDLEGNVRIMDFGIARSLRAPGITSSGVLIGTPEYMSPEQAEAEELDQRSDIYSLGVILYEMVTGRVPFSGDTPLSIALKHINAVPPDPRALNALVSEDLSRLILKCLEKDKEKRQRSADELLAELKEIRKEAPAVEKASPPGKPVTSREITVKFGLKKVLWPALILAGVILLGLVSWRLVPRQRNVPHRTYRIPEFKTPAPPPTPLEGQAQEQADKLLPDLVKKKADDARSSAGVSGFLESVVREAEKYLNQQEYDQLKKNLDTIKGRIPAGSRLMTMWNEAEAKIKQAEKSNEQGKVLESRKSYQEGQNQMAKLLTTVEEKDRADAARAEMDQEKERAAEELPAPPKNLLFRVASAGERDAADAYGRDDFSGARTLYTVLKNVFGLSLQAADEPRAVRVVQGYVGRLRSEADAERAAELAAWHYREAQKEESRAEAFFRKGDLLASVETYVQAAFLYEKAKEKSVEAHQSK